MRAIAIERFGEQPRLMELPTPEPGPGEVLVKLEAASVNPMDWRVAVGAFEGRLPQVFPLILGFDGAGRVEAVGREVRGFAVGDGVLGQLWASPIGKGTFAEYVATPVELANGAVGHVPEGLSMAAAAALPTAGITAVGAVEAIGCGPGTTVLIIGASGGVGSFATQLAAARGAHVIATARADAERWIRGLGASETIDYAERPVPAALATAHPEGIDALLELVGDKRLFAAAAKHVRDGGVASSIAFAATPELAENGRITASNYMNERKPELLERASVEVASRRISAEIRCEVTLDEAPAALARNRDGGARGKTVIRI